MTLADFVDDVASERKTLLVYTSEDEPAVTVPFDTRNVTVEHESLPAGGPEGFAVLRDEGGFLGAFGLAQLEALLSPPIIRPWRYDQLCSPWRDLYRILDNSLFASFDRRQLLSATREIENRAWRIGTGTLRAGFQSGAAYRKQLQLYRRLGTETDLEIHVYFDDEWDQAAEGGIHVHSVGDSEIGNYWTVVFDAAGDPTNAGAVLAEEREPGAFFGFWTYDPDRVDAIATYLHETYE